ncbi:MAG: hypothetical protein LUE27_03135, partial [Clostridia bacterium]|nr:hypothetical protein [Clostridia bacterium]
MKWKTKNRLLIAFLTVLMTVALALGIVFLNSNEGDLRIVANADNSNDSIIALIDDVLDSDDYKENEDDYDDTIIVGSASSFKESISAALEDKDAGYYAVILLMDDEDCVTISEGYTIDFFPGTYTLSYSADKDDADNPANSTITVESGAVLNIKAPLLHSADGEPSPRGLE